MICVTGAGGTVSSDLIKQLESANAPFRAAHFSNAKAEAARARGIDAVIIDYDRPEMLRAAFQGCDKLFLLGPNAPNQSELEQKRRRSGEGGWRAAHREAVRPGSRRRGLQPRHGSSARREGD